MVKSTTKRTVPYRRKREGKTNYKKRLELLKSRQNRLIIRRTNKHFILQVVEYFPDGDKILVGLTSKRLERFGWTGSQKNLPAAYLTGVLLAKEAVKKGVKGAIFDIGLQTPIKGSRIYAALKGAIDGGLAIPASASVFPAEDRITGKHLENKDVAASFEKVRKAIEQA